MAEKQQDKEGLAIIVLFYIMYRSSEREWDKMRESAKDEGCIKEYLCKLFNDDYNEEIIPENSHFFRARQILQNDHNDLEINKIFLEELKVLIKEFEDLNVINSKVNLDFSDFLLIKSLADEDEKEKLLSIMTPLLEKIKNTNFLGFNEINSGPPPLSSSRDGRLNYINDQFLYLAYDVNTALTEMRPIINQEFSVAECVTTKDLRIVNLHAYNSTKNQKSLFSNFYIISKKVSEPNTEPNSKDSTNANFYRITQILAHYLKEKGFDGISYKSSLLENGVNLVLFNPKNVKFIGSKIMRIKSVRVEYEDYLESEDMD